jgi:hypothetical protein
MDAMARRTDHGRATAVDPRTPEPAPGDLRIVQAFVNTADRVRGTDELSSPQALADWLAFQGLSETPPLGDSDLERAIEVREGLRSCLAADPEDLEGGAALNAALSEALVRARFGPAGELRLEPAAPGIDAAFGRLLAIRHGPARRALAAAQDLRQLRVPGRLLRWLEKPLREVVRAAVRQPPQRPGLPATETAVAPQKLSRAGLSTSRVKRLRS